MVILRIETVRVTQESWSETSSREHAPRRPGPNSASQRQHHPHQAPPWQHPLPSSFYFQDTRVSPPLHSRSCYSRPIPPPPPLLERLPRHPAFCCLLLLHPAFLSLLLCPEGSPNASARYLKLPHHQTTAKYCLSECLHRPCPGP